MDYGKPFLSVVYYHVVSSLETVPIRDGKTAASRQIGRFTLFISEGINGVTDGIGYSVGYDVNYRFLKCEGIAEDSRLNGNGVVSNLSGYIPGFFSAEMKNELTVHGDSGSMITVASPDSVSD